MEGGADGGYATRQPDRPWCPDSAVGVGFPPLVVLQSPRCRPQPPAARYSPPVTPRPPAGTADFRCRSGQITLRSCLCSLSAVSSPPTEICLRFSPSRETDPQGSRHPVQVLKSRGPVCLRWREVTVPGAGRPRPPSPSVPGSLLAPPAFGVLPSPRSPGARGVPSPSNACVVCGWLNTSVTLVTTNMLTTPLRSEVTSPHAGLMGLATS